MSYKHPLARWREEQKMSQRELGRLLGVSQQTIFRYESGTRTPRAKVIALIEEITGATVVLRHFTAAASGIDDPHNGSAAI